MSSYKHGSIPGSRAYVEELADFWEIEAIKIGGLGISMREIWRVLNKELDELAISGIESEDDRLDNHLHDVWEEIKRRQIACVGCYPFDLLSNKLRVIPEWDSRHSIYVFMLLATRFNMTTNKILDGIDGTKVFEHVCACVAAELFGGNSQSMVFGTAVQEGFEPKVRKLAGMLGEGGDFRNPNPSRITKNDDGIDIVVWKNFADDRKGKLIGFGQCKTGTDWRDSIRKLDPSQFCRNWFTEPFVIDPVPMVFLCDTMNYERNFISDQAGFLVLNRFRIAEYAPANWEKPLLEALEKWVAGGLVFIGRV